jgi:hypothetical protein
VIEDRWKFHTEHRNSLIRLYRDTRQKANDILCPGVTSDGTTLANVVRPEKPLIYLYLLLGSEYFQDRIAVLIQTDAVEPNGGRRI